MIGPEKAANRAMTEGWALLSKDNVKTAIVVLAVLYAVFTFLENGLQYANSMFGLTGLAVSLFLLVALGFAYIYFYIQFIATLLRESGIEVRDVGYGIKAMFAFAGVGLTAFFLWMDKKLLAIFGAAFLALALGALFTSGLVQMALSGIIVFVATLYLAAAGYHGVRLFGAGYLYIMGRPFSEGLKESWDLVAGRTMSVFAFILVVVIVTGITGAIISAIATAIIYAASPANSLVSKTIGSLITMPFSLISQIFITSLLLQMIRVRDEASAPSGRSKTNARQ